MIEFWLLKVYPLEVKGSFSSAKREANSKE